MMELIIKEVSNLNSNREGYVTLVFSVDNAKKIANKKQAFKGTTLKIESNTGTLLAYKKPNEQWVDMP